MGRPGYIPYGEDKPVLSSVIDCDHSFSSNRHFLAGLAERIIGPAVRRRRHHVAIIEANGRSPHGRFYAATANTVCATITVSIRWYDRTSS